MCEWLAALPYMGAAGLLVGAYLHGLFVMVVCERHGVSDEE